MPDVLRYAAFAAPALAAPALAPRDDRGTTAEGQNHTEGGNPAGIVLDAAEMSDAEMQQLAAEVGFAETAFVVEPHMEGDPHRSRVRYFSPIAEVPFCGHATIATAVVLAERTGPGRYTFDTAVGEVVIDTHIANTPTAPGTVSAPGAITAAFTSVPPEVRPLDPAVLQRLLALLGLADTDLDDRYPVRVSYAGNWHPMLVLRDIHLFNEFRFDPAAVRALMDAEGWAGTVTVLYARSPNEFEARNLFPVGAITEDPATGSAAASLGGYLREEGLVDVPAKVIVHQGRHVGRPSLLTVDIHHHGGIVVSGTAVPIT
jgi:PhzF family phenazine biosynthesis protein